MDFYTRLELLTRKRIFYLLLILVPVILPPVTASGFGYLFEVADFSVYLAGALFDYKSLYAHWMPALHAAMLLAILLLLLFRQKVGRLFALFVALNLALSVYTQTMVTTSRYGLVILTELFIWYVMVIALWLWETLIQKSSLSFRGGMRPWWLIPLAIIAFWDPDIPWDLSLDYFIHGFAPVAFCMLTPIYVIVLLFATPSVNLPLLRIHTFVGLIVGFLSLFISLVQNPSAGVYWILLHAPLIIISSYGFYHGIRLRPTAPQTST